MGTQIVANYPLMNSSLVGRAGTLELDMTLSEEPLWAVDDEVDTMTGLRAAAERTEQPRMETRRRRFTRAAPLTARRAVTLRRRPTPSPFPRPVSRRCRRGPARHRGFIRSTSSRCGAGYDCRWRAVGRPPDRLTTIAEQFSVWPITISRLERGQQCNDTHARRLP